MSIFDSSTPVPFQQDSPEVSVKAPKFTPKVSLSDRAKETLIILAGFSPKDINLRKSTSGDYTVVVRNIVLGHLSNDIFSPNQAFGIHEILGSFPVPELPPQEWFPSLPDEAQSILLDNWPLLNLAQIRKLIIKRIKAWVRPQPVQQQQANAGLDGQQEPVNIPFPTRDPLFFMGGEYPTVFDIDEPITIDEWTVANIRNFCNGTGLTQDQILPFLQFIVDTGHAVHNQKYVIVKPTWELLDEFVSTLLSPKYPVMDFPALPVDAGVKHQLDRMESFLMEIKAAVVVDADLIGGYSMPFIPPVLDDFDQALEEAKAQQEAAESAPELLTEEEINRIYQSVSRDVERKEYDRLINKVIALNNYAKGVR